MEIKKIGVPGAGVMGSGIAQVSAEMGFQVYLRDIDDRFVQGGRNTIRKNLEKGISKGKMTQQKAEGVLAKITGGVDLTAALKDADLVIEAVTESMDLKKKLYREMDPLCPPERFWPRIHQASPSPS